MNERVRVDERPQGLALGLSTVQWFVFLVANTLTVPVVMGHALGLSPSDITLYTERTFFVCGIIGLLQAFLGHRFPVMEAPAGMWWGVFIVLVQMAKDQGNSMNDLLRQTEMGLMIGALIFIVMGAFGLLGFIRRLFTPIISGTFLILVALQLSKTLVEGVLGIGYRNQPNLSVGVAVLSVIVMALTILLSFKGSGIVKSMSILIGLIAGWVLFAAFGFVDWPSAAPEMFKLPAIFPFGAPSMNWGITLTCVLTSMILLSNLVASLQAFGLAVDEEITDRKLNRGALVTGVGTAFAGIFGLVGAMPMAISAGFVTVTGIASRLPFILASAAVALLGFFPFLGAWLATIPAPLGYAIMLVAIAQLIGFGLRDYKEVMLDQRNIYVLGLSLLFGVGIFGIPTSAFGGLPPVFVYILDNGLIVGIILALLLEHLLFRRKKPEVQILK
ncbi:xanthine permease [Paenibacillus oralis]|uniref:Xanthine permease n=1 Tax=Paenibacillus oralis TaxID=2490856 RepID=A0A3P3U9V8_9BACL|nr:purine/pyrimidine permease [Paenibacillus oralis]RRJ67141.1 xanthine permease [Paenibacillus oralis]